MAVPPPQQKFFSWPPSMVTTDAFHAARRALGKELLLGMNQRMVVVAPMRESARGATMWCSQVLPGRPSESTKTRTSKSGGSCPMAARRLLTFSLEVVGFPATTTWAFTREEAATRLTRLYAGSVSEARMKKTSKF